MSSESRSRKGAQPYGEGVSESMILNDRHQGALRCMGPREGAGCFPWHGGNRRNGPVRTGCGKDFQMGS